jgi:hypothetical protein
MKSNKDKAVCTWFVEPLNEYTNEAVFRNQEFLSEDGIYRGVTCADGKSHNLCKCKDYSFIPKLIHSKSTDSNLSFTVWVQEGQSAIRKWKLGGKPKKTKATVKALADLKQKI